MTTTTMLKALGTITILSLAASACTDRTPSQQTGAGSTSGTNVAFEEALADAESGRNPDRTESALEGFLAETLSNEDRARADLALSRLVETKDQDRAAKLLEDAVVLGDRTAETRLAELLTGSALPPQHRRPTFIPPAAHAFANAFPAATPERKVDVDVIRIGAVPNEDGSDKHGTFEIAGALRQKATEACGCEDPKTSINASRSVESSWTAIPRYASRLDRALVVVYVDEQTIVPERYAQWLAAPASDIKTALARGEGMVAVKERPGAPPIVTIAAPRASQFDEVEESFAYLKELPARHVVTLPKGLSPEEIHSVIEPRMKGLAACASGSPDPLRASLNVTYQILGTGMVTDVHIEGKDADPGARACVEKALAGIRFPAWSKEPNAKMTKEMQFGVSSSVHPEGAEMRNVHRVMKTMKFVKDR